MFNDKRLTFIETLSATSLLVSLTQGNNSFFMYSSPGITPQSVNRQQSPPLFIEEGDRLRWRSLLRETIVLGS